MTWDAHSFVGLFQSIFYLPTLVVAAYLLFFKHGRPRLVWIALTVFCLVRLVGGILLILFEDHQDSVAWIIVATIFQGTGVIPLILTTVGMLRVIKSVDFPESDRIRNAILAMRLLFLAGLALLIAGSVLIGNYKNTDDVKTGLKLAKAGYIVIAVIIAIVFAFDVFFWSRSKSLSHTSRRVLIATTISIPFLIVRITYACLGVFQTGAKATRWSPLYGSIAALVVMHSMMEYIVVVIYISVGVLVAPIGKNLPGAGPVALQERRDIAAEQGQAGPLENLK